MGCTSMNRRRRAPSRRRSIRKRYRLLSESNRRPNSSAAGVGGPIYADMPAPSGEYPDESSFFEIAPLDPPVVEVESNLGQNEVVLGSETHASSSDHERLGNVTAFELGDMGLVESITVSEGLIFKEWKAFR